MRVLHLTTEFPPVVYGGLGTSIGGMAHASAQAGVDVVVLLVGESATYAPGRSMIDGKRDMVLLKDGVTVCRTTWTSAIADALRLCRRQRPDVIHLHVFWLWELARALREKTGIPVLYTVHSLDVAEYHLGNGPPECLEMWNVQLEVLSRSDRIHAPSRSEAALVQQYCPQAVARTAVAGHGIDDPWGEPRRTPRPETGPQTGEVTILFVGRFVDRKGIRELLEAVPSVLEQNPSAKFVLAGGHRHVTAEEMRAWWLPSTLDNRSSRIQFTGWVDADDTADLYARADVLAIPSWYEPFGMVVLEGMLEGLAIAASNIGGPGEILEHEVTGLLFPPRDTSALAAALTRLACDADLRNRLGNAAANDVRARWLWPTAIKPVIAMYEQAARSEGSAA